MSNPLEKLLESTTVATGAMVGQTVTFAKEALQDRRVQFALVILSTFAGLGAIRYPKIAFKAGQIILSFSNPSTLGKFATIVALAEKCYHHFIMAEERKGFAQERTRLEQKVDDLERVVPQLQEAGGDIGAATTQLARRVRDLDAATERSEAAAARNEAATSALERTVKKNEASAERLEKATREMQAVSSFFKANPVIGQLVKFAQQVNAQKAQSCAAAVGPAMHAAVAM